MQLSLALDPNPVLSLIRDCLASLDGRQRDDRRHDPTAQFVKAMISACTWDAVSDEAFRRLCAAVLSWDLLPDIEPAVIAAIIKDVKYAADKACHLVTAARIIRARRGRFDLAFLAGWPLDAAFSWLDRLPGAGPKVAAATLNFSTLRKRVLAVDRHVLRIAWRYGLVPGKTDFARGLRRLMRLVPDTWDADDLYELHWLLKAHGQTICTDRWPACESCSLAQHCAGRELT
jgi:endonuclease III